MNLITSNNSFVSNVLGKTTNDVFYILYTSIIGSILLAISSKIQIPLTPVPVTLQTLVLLVMSMLVGWRGALGASLLYLFQGSIGLPVFAHGAGLAYLFGPTGGYLFGFILASIVVGFLAEKGWDKSIILTFVTLTIGTLLIYFCENDIRLVYNIIIYELIIRIWIHLHLLIYHMKNENMTI